MNGKPLRSEAWRDIIAVGSLVITLIGFVLAWFQLRKTKSAALAARDSAQRAGEESHRNFRRFVLSTAKRYLIETKISVEAANWGHATLRLGDLADQISQLTEHDPGWVSLLEDLRAWESKNIELPFKVAQRKKWETLIQNLQMKIDSSHGPFKQTSR